MRGGPWYWTVAGPGTHALSTPPGTGSGRRPVSGELEAHVKRALLAIATAVVLAATLAPLALAADDATDPTPAPVVDPTAEPTPTPFVNGEPVEDPTFILAPTPTPAGAVKGITGRRVTPTPPPTDTIDAPAAKGTALQVLMGIAVVGSLVALLAAPVPAKRRR